MLPILALCVCLVCLLIVLWVLWDIYRFNDNLAKCGEAWSQWNEVQLEIELAFHERMKKENESAEKAKLKNDHH